MKSHPIGAIWGAGGRFRIAVLVAAALFGVLYSPAQSPKAQQPESGRLIDSIQGPNLYKAYCAVCHGTDAKGQGPMAKELRTAPPDLTRIAARSGGKFPSARMRKVISGEELLSAGHGTREMPIWGPVFSQVGQDQDLGPVRIDNLARYLESLQVK